MKRGKRPSKLVKRSVHPRSPKANFRFPWNCSQRVFWAQKRILMVIIVFSYKFRIFWYIGCDQTHPSDPLGVSRDITRNSTWIFENIMWKWEYWSSFHRMWNLCDIDRVVIENGSPKVGKYSEADLLIFFFFNPHRSADYVTLEDHRSEMSHGIYLNFVLLL